LILVDLAGSEKVKKTASEGVRLTEANSINGSLLVLGRVVNALIDGKQTHVPYRESKLTRLLQYPLSGMGKTSIVVTCSPSMYNRDETLAAVYFGQRAMKLKVNAKVHEKVDWKALALKLQAMLEGGMDCVRKETIEEQRLDYEKQIQEYKERAECLERQVLGELGDVGKRDKKELADENHALRELVRALQSKVIKLDDRRKIERKERKTLQLNHDNAVNDHMNTQISLKEMEHKVKVNENQLIDVQNQVITLSSEIRRMHKDLVKSGLPGCNADVLANLASPRAQQLAHRHTFIDLVDEDSGDEGTLEVGSPEKGFSEEQVSDIRLEDQAYGDTSEQLVQALQEVQNLKQEKRRLMNEAKITALSSRKAMVRIQELEQENKRSTDLIQFLESNVERLKYETGAQEKERYQTLVQRMTEYEARMDKYRTQMQRATNEARIEANAKDKLKNKVEALEEEKANNLEQTRKLEHQIHELSLRLTHRIDHRIDDPNTCSTQSISDMEDEKSG